MSDHDSTVDSGQESREINEISKGPQAGNLILLDGDTSINDYIFLIILLLIEDVETLCLTEK